MPNWRSCKQSQRIKEISSVSNIRHINSGPVSAVVAAPMVHVALKNEKWNSPNTAHMNEASRYFAQLGNNCEKKKRNRGSGLIFLPRPIHEKSDHFRKSDLTVSQLAYGTGTGPMKKPNPGQDHVLPQKRITVKF